MFDELTNENQRRTDPLVFLDGQNQEAPNGVIPTHLQTYSTANELLQEGNRSNRSSDVLSEQSFKSNQSNRRAAQISQTQPQRRNTLVFKTKRQTTNLAHMTSQSNMNNPRAISTNLPAQQQPKVEISKKDNSVLTMLKRVHIVFLHMIEAILCALVLMNALWFSQISTVLYLVVDICVLLVLLLTGKRAFVITKLVFVIFCMICAFTVLMMKMVAIIQTWTTPENINMMHYCGVFDNQLARTFVPDSIMFVLCIFLTIYYVHVLKLPRFEKGLPKVEEEEPRSPMALLNQLEKQQSKSQTSFINEPGAEKVEKPKISYFLSQKFARCWSWFYALTVFIIVMDCLILQSIIQIVMLLLILTSLQLWAKESAHLNTMANYFLMTCQLLYIFQACGTFAVEFPTEAKELTSPERGVYFQIFGFQLEFDLKKITVIGHLLCMTLTIFMAEVTRVAVEINSKLPKQIKIVPMKQVAHVKTMKPLTKTEKLYIQQQGMQPEEYQAQNAKDPCCVTMKNMWDQTKPSAMLWLCRISTWIWIYMYHDYQALILILWLVYSFVFTDMKLFIKLTVWFFMPLFCLIFLFYYCVNIPGVIDWKTSPVYATYTFEVEYEKLNKWYNKGLYKWNYPALESGMFLLILYLFFKFIKYDTQKVKGLGANDIEKIMQTMSLKSTSSLLQLAFLAIVSLDFILMLILLVFGVTRVNLFRILLLVFFVLYMVSPRTFRKYSVVLVLYMCSFVIGIYVYTLESCHTTLENQSMLQVIGLYALYDCYGINEYFRYNTGLVSLWILVLLAFFQFRINNMVYKHESAEQYIKETKKTVSKKMPTFHKTYLYLSNLYTNTIIFFGILIFFLIIILQNQRTLLLWLTQVILLVLILIYMASGTGMLIKYWTILVVYQAFVLLTQIFFQFLALPPILSSPGMTAFYDQLPVWLTENLKYIGYIPYDKHSWLVLPYLIMFVLAAHMSSQLKLKKALEDKEINLLNQPIGDYEARKSMEASKKFSQRNSSASSLSGLRSALLNDDYYWDIHKHMTDIRFMTSYILYKNKWSWIWLTLFCNYYHVILNLAVVCFAIEFQLSFIWFLMLFSLVFFMFNIISHNIKSRQQFKKSFDDVHQKPVDDQVDWDMDNFVAIECDNAIDQVDMYHSSKITISVASRRAFWRLQMFIIISAISLIYISTFILTFNLSEQNLSQTIFFMFWAGIYSDATDYKQYIAQSWPFYFMLILLCIEKGCIHWLTDKCGCSKEIQQKFKQIEDEHKRLVKKKYEEKKLLASQALRRTVMSQHSSRGHSRQNSQGSENSSKIESAQSSVVSREAQEELQKKVSELAELAEVEEEIPEPEDADSMKTKRMLEIEEERSSIMKELKPLLDVKYQMRMRQQLKIVLEEITILLVWISLIYKQNVLSFILFFLVAIYSYFRTEGKLIFIWKLIIAFILVSYAVSLSNFSSYNNVMTFPPQLTTNTTSGVDYYVYPNIEIYEYDIPWFMSVDLLKNHLNVANFLALGITKQSLYGLYIDYALCVVVILYLLNCNYWLLFTRKIKVVNSQQMNDLLDRILKLNAQEKKEQQEFAQQKKQEFMLNQLQGDNITASQRKYLDNTNQEELIVLADEFNDVQRKELLREIKETLGTRKVQKNISEFAFVNFQFFMITINLVICLLNFGLLSFGYFLILLAIILDNKNYLATDQSKYKLGFILKYILLPYLFFDILAQLIYSIPIEGEVNNSDGIYQTNWPEIVGIQKVWDVEAVNNLGKSSNSISLTFNGTIIVLKSSQFVNLMLKGLMYFFISLQLQILESQEYRRFKMKLISLNSQISHLRGLGIAYRFNNFKIQSFIQQAKEEAHIDNLLVDVKQRLLKWQILQKKTKEGELWQQAKDIESDPMHLMMPQETSTSKKVSKEIDAELVKGIEEQETKKLESQLVLEGIAVEDAEKEKSILSELSKKKDQLETKEPMTPEEIVKTELKKRMKALPWYVKLYLYLRKNYVNHIMFKESLRAIEETVEIIRSGKVCKPSKIEIAMYMEVQMDLGIFLDDFTSNSQNIAWKKVGSKQYRSCCNMFKKYMILFLRIAMSYSELFCYLFMLVAAMHNAGILYLVFPFMIFGFALLEESKPQGYFWYFCLFYTTLLVGIQFFFILTFWDTLSISKPVAEYNAQQALYKSYLGIYIFKTPSFWNTFVGFFPQILVIVSVLLYIQNQTLNGVFNISIYDIESFPDALLRYKLNVLKDDEEEKQKLLSQLRSDEQLKEPIVPGEYKLRRSNSLPLNYKFELLDYKINEYEKNYSENDARNLILPVTPKKNAFGQFMKKALVKNNYTLRLFPEIKQQKPGIDLYAYIASIQFILCLYIIFFYNKMNGQSSTISEEVKENHFSGQMVFCLFCMIIIMLIDRIIYSSQTFVTNEQAMAKKSTPKPESENNSQENKFEDSFSKSDSNDSSLSVEDDFTKNKVTYMDKLTISKSPLYFMKVVKVYYLWFVLLLVNVFVFIIMPMEGNYNLHHSIYCNLNDLHTSEDSYQCNLFQENAALIIFYLLFLLYFFVSAMHIRYGMPETRKGSFLIGNSDSISKYIYETYLALPFMFELRSIVDWTFQETALDLFQWIKLATIQASMFVAKCENKKYMDHPLGEKQGLLKKIVFGVGLTFFVLLCIAGPLLLFSSYNPIAVNNPITTSDLIVQFRIVEDSGITTTIKIFETEQQTELKPLNQSMYTAMNYSQQYNSTQQFSVSQGQFIQMSLISDSTWDIAPPKKQLLTGYLKEAAQNTTQNFVISLDVITKFDRSAGQYKIAQSNTSTILDYSDDQSGTIDSLIDALQCQNQNSSIYSTQFQTIQSSTWILDSTQTAFGVGGSEYQIGMDLVYHCNPNQTAGTYWSVKQILPDNSPILNPVIETEAQLQMGLTYIVFSQKVLPSYINVGLIGFYVGIVYVISVFFRSVFVPKTANIYIYDATYTDDILAVCQAIYIYRVQKKLEEEEELFMILIDIMRSPEMIKQITGTSLKKKLT